MAHFDKEAHLMENGESPQRSVVEWPTRTTTISSSGTLVKKSDPASDTENGSQIDGRRSSLWTLLRRLCSRHKPEDAPSEASDAAEPTASACDTEKRELVVRSLKDFPTGYPNLATFADSDESFMLYRRFGYLQSRVLLEKQAELRSLEEQLDKLDSSEMYDEPDNLYSRESQGEERKGLLTQIETRFCEYANVLAAAQQLMTFNRPGKDEHRSVLHYLEDQSPIEEKEREYVYRKEDLITLRPGREHAWLDRAIEKALRYGHCRPLEWIFCTKETKKKSLDSSQVYYEKERIDACANGIITLMIVFLLIVPIYFEYHVVARNNGLMTPKSNAICIGILLVFTLVFSAILSCFTKAKRHEILGAAAAYCAVLVVFLGNVGKA